MKTKMDLFGRLAGSGLILSALAWGGAQLYEQNATLARVEAKIEAHSGSNSDHVRRSDLERFFTENRKRTEQFYSEMLEVYGAPGVELANQPPDLGPRELPLPHIPFYPPPPQFLDTMQAPEAYFDSNPSE